MKLTSEIKAAIESSYNNGVSAFGIRRMTGGIIAQVGDDVAPSFTWEDGEQTDEELGGTSAIGFDVEFGEADEESFAEAMSLMDQYEGQLVIIAGDQNLDAIHNDCGEIVIAEAVVIAVLEG